MRLSKQGGIHNPAIDEVLLDDNGQHLGWARGAKGREGGRRVIHRAREPSFSLETEQTVRGQLHAVFAFFSDPGNLEAITPPWLQFRVLRCSTPEIEEGTTIDYRLKLHGVPLRWKSVIRAWEPPFGFVDEQEVGPYRSWVHYHTFRETDGGVLIRDQVEYSVLGGALVDRLFVRRDLKKIFAYRKASLASLLGDDG